MAIASVPSVEPDTIFAGDSLTWNISNGDYKASDGWTLEYILLTSTGQITITSTASGDDHLVTVAKATTANYTAGTYDWRAYFYDDDERYAYKTGVMVIEADWTEEDSGYDTRSHAKIMLDAIEATMQSKATSDQLEIKIGDREIKRLSATEMVKWRNFYREEYLKEQRSEAIDNGDTSDTNNLYGVYR